MSRVGLVGGWLKVVRYYYISSLFSLTKYFHYESIFLYDDVFYDTGICSIVCQGKMNSMGIVNKINYSIGKYNTTASTVSSSKRYVD